MDRELDRFRTLTFLSGASLAVAVAVSYLPMPLSEAQIELLGQGGHGALATPEISEILWWAWLVLCAGAHVLAFCFSWWSKPFFLATFPFTIAASVVNGVTIHSPWDSTAWTCQSVFFTFTVGMLFFSPRVKARMRADWRSIWFAEPYRSPAATPMVSPSEDP